MSVLNKRNDAPNSTVLSYTSSKFEIHRHSILGFDLDHALARYKNRALGELIYTCLLKALVEKFNYPSSIFSSTYTSKYVQRGIIFDFLFELVNFLRLCIDSIVLSIV